MRLAITQPNFLPWLGYFDLLDQVDIWVSLDNVQLGGRSFISRNRIKLQSGSSRWLSVALRNTSQKNLICDQQLSDQDWHRKLTSAIASNYHETPYHHDLVHDLDALLTPETTNVSLARYNERIIHSLAERLGISYEFHRASDLETVLTGKPQDKIFSLLGHFEASEFLNFQRGVDLGLYNPGDFAARNIQLLKQDYQHPQYRQLGETFEPYLSVVDLLLNEGPRSLSIIRSGSRWSRPPTSQDTDTPQQSEHEP